MAMPGAMITEYRRCRVFSSSWGSQNSFSIALRPWAQTPYEIWNMNVYGLWQIHYTQKWCYLRILDFFEHLGGSRSYWKCLQPSVINLHFVNRFSCERICVISHDTPNQDVDRYVIVTHPACSTRQTVSKYKHCSHARPAKGWAHVSYASFTYSIRSTSKFANTLDMILKHAPKFDLFASRTEMFMFCFEHIPPARPDHWWVDIIIGYTLDQRRGEQIYDIWYMMYVSGISHTLGQRRNRPKCQGHPSSIRGICFFLGRPFVWYNFWLKCD